jgi:thioredoxin-related protein
VDEEDAVEHGTVGRRGTGESVMYKVKSFKSEDRLEEYLKEHSELRPIALSSHRVCAGFMDEEKFTVILEYIK